MTIDHRSAARTARRTWLAPLLALCVVGAAQAQLAPNTQTPAESFAPVVGQPGKDVVWVPTPDAVVQAMLDMARVGPNDVVYDLGSGDGKIAIAAARRGARALGIEYNPAMVEVSKRNAAAAGVANVGFVQGDIFESDFSSADVVTLYLLPSLNQRLRPILLKMRPGTRVASHQFTMGDWEPDQTQEIEHRQALMWTVPANVAGRWSVRIGNTESLSLDLEQRFQRLEGSAKWGAAAQSALRDAAIDGANVRFTAADASGAVHRFRASAGHDGRMSGKVTDADGAERAFTATRTWEERR